MGSTFMLCAFDQESGVHGILVPMSMLCWVVPPRGTTRATVSTGGLSYFSNSVALQGMPFLAKARPELKISGRNRYQYSLLFCQRMQKFFTFFFHYRLGLFPCFLCGKSILINRYFFSE